MNAPSSSRRATTARSPATTTNSAIYARRNARDPCPNGRRCSSPRADRCPRAPPPTRVRRPPGRPIVASSTSSTFPPRDTVPESSSSWRWSARRTTDRGSCRRNSACGATPGKPCPIRSTGRLRKCSLAPGRRIRRSHRQLPPRRASCCAAPRSRRRSGSCARRAAVAFARPSASDPSTRFAGIRARHGNCACVSRRASRSNCR